MSDKICQTCEEPIPPKRVAANPKVQFCVGCQEIREKDGKFVRHSIEIGQEITGWSFDGVVQVLVRGS